MLLLMLNEIEHDEVDDFCSGVFTTSEINQTVRIIIFLYKSPPKLFIVYN